MHIHNRRFCHQHHSVCNEEPTLSHRNTQFCESVRDNYRCNRSNLNTFYFLRSAQVNHSGRYVQREEPTAICGDNFFPRRRFLCVPSYFYQTKTLCGCGIYARRKIMRLFRNKNRSRGTCFLVSLFSSSSSRSGVFSSEIVYSTRECLTFLDYVTQLKNNDFVVVAAASVGLVERSHGTLNAIQMTQKKLCTNTCMQTRAYSVLYETKERDWIQLFGKSISPMRL